MTDTTELRRLLAEATPGPWSVEEYPDMPGSFYVKAGVFGLHENAALIVAARNALPALLDENDRLREALTNWKCPSCGGTGEYHQRGRNQPSEGRIITCKLCNGDGLHRQARAALEEPK